VKELAYREAMAALDQAGGGCIVGRALVGLVGARPRGDGGQELLAMFFPEVAERRQGAAP